MAAVWAATWQCACRGTLSTGPQGGALPCPTAQASCHLSCFIRVINIVVTMTVLAVECTVLRSQVASSVVAHLTALTHSQPAVAAVTRVVVQGYLHMWEECYKTHAEHVTMYIYNIRWLVHNSHGIHTFHCVLQACYICSLHMALTVQHTASESKSSCSIPSIATSWEKVGLSFGRGSQQLLIMVYLQEGGVHGAQREHSQSQWSPTQLFTVPVHSTD